MRFRSHSIAAVTLGASFLLVGPAANAFHLWSGSSAALAAAMQDEEVQEPEEESSDALDDSAESAEDGSKVKESAEEDAAGAEEEDVAIDTEETDSGETDSGETKEEGSESNDGSADKADPVEETDSAKPESDTEELPADLPAEETPAPREPDVVVKPTAPAPQEPDAVVKPTAPGPKTEEMRKREEEFRRITGGEQLYEGTPEQIRQKEQRLDGWLDEMKRVREQQLAASLDEEKRRAVADPCHADQAFPKRRSIRFVHDGGYIADFYVDWQSPCRPSSWASGRVAFGYAEYVVIPNTATSIKIRATNMTGVVWDPTKLIFERNELQLTGELCFRVSGTSLDPKVSDC